MVCIVVISGTTIPFKYTPLKCTCSCFINSHICETPVTEQTFIEQLHELHHKINFAKEQSFKGALSVNDVGDVLENLKVKVTSQMSANPGLNLLTIK